MNYKLSSTSGKDSSDIIYMQKHKHKLLNALVSEYSNNISISTNTRKTKRLSLLMLILGASEMQLKIKKTTDTFAALILIEGD